jgi:hypothetical protein
MKSGKNRAVKGKHISDSEAEKLLAKALSEPGVKDIMKVMGHVYQVEQALRPFNSLLNEKFPLVAVSNNTSGWK